MLPQCLIDTEYVPERLICQVEVAGFPGQVTGPKYGSAEFAVSEGERAQAAGDSFAATRWFDRASRMTAGDPTVVLMLASSLCISDPEQARDLLEGLLQRTPRIVDAWVALIAIHLRLNNIDAAATGLSAMLRAFRPPMTGPFARLANSIVERAQAPGWVGFDCKGHLVASLATGKIASRMRVALDGSAVTGIRFTRLSGLLTCDLPESWRIANTVEVTLQGAPLLGSGIDVLRRRESTGFVSYVAGVGMRGYAWLPADTAAIPVIFLQSDPSSVAVPIEVDVTPSVLSSGEFGFSFAIPENAIAGASRVRVLTETGSDLWGSPLWPNAECDSARSAAFMQARALGATQFGKSPEIDLWRPLHVSAHGHASKKSKPSKSASTNTCDIVIPVHNGLGDLQRCLLSLLSTLPVWARIIIVDDGSTDQDIRMFLKAKVAEGRITLLHHPIRRGFPSAVNTGMRLTLQTPNRDVVLLNSDTMLPENWLQRLRTVCNASSDIGSATPLTHDGTIVSVSDIETLGALDTPEAVMLLDRQCAIANLDQSVDIPTAVGFCMFIRRDCLAQTGLFREDVFAQGYGEENDWCLRARQFGWRHVAATGVFVAHFGGRSFGSAKTFLIERNMEILNRLHPGYDAYVTSFDFRDALNLAWRRVNEGRWKETYANRPAILLVTHDQGGGVQHYIDARCQAFARAGADAFILAPSPDARGSACKLSDPRGIVSSMTYDFATERAAIVALLKAFRIQTVEIHHLLGHAPEIVDLASLLDVPCMVYLHDYGAWCPRFNLVGKNAKYCGEPSDIRDCQECIHDLGTSIVDFDSVAAHRARGARLLGTAQAVIVPDAGVQKRISRYFPEVATLVRPWGNDALLPPVISPMTGSHKGICRIVIVGAIGPAKGSDVLLACARDAVRRNLPIEFYIVGFTDNDAALLDTGKVFISGRYKESEVLTLIARCESSIGFLPSIWPETWCFALTAMLQAGLRVTTFDIGVQASRILASQRGYVLPLGTPASRINDTLLLQSAES